MYSFPTHCFLTFYACLQRKDSKSVENPHDGSATSCEVSVQQNSITHGTQSIASDGMEAVDLQNSDFTSSYGASANSSDQQYPSMECISLKNSNLVQQNATTSPKYKPLPCSSTGTAITSKYTIGLKAQQSTEESSAELSTSQSTEDTKQQHQQGICKNNTQEEELGNCHNTVTKDREAFQQYLVQKQLNHLTKENRKQTIENDLQHCLFMHTDLDVLDENNKFICHKCTARKQRMHNLATYM